MNRKEIFRNKKFKISLAMNVLMFGVLCFGAWKVSVLQGECESLEKLLTAQDVAISKLTQDRQQTLEENDKLKLSVETLMGEVAAFKEEKQIASTFLDFESTAYTSTGDTESFITATGSYVDNQTVAVDPRVIPLGTKLEINFPNNPEYNGVYYARDTGGAINGNIIDVYVDSVGEAYNFGRQPCKVRILD